MAYPNKTVLIVSHGTIMRLLLIHLGYGTYTELSRTTHSIKNGAYIKLACNGIDFKILETQGVKKLI